MTKGVTYTTKNLTAWNENRLGEIELDAIARVYLGDAEITDRDRIAFALRELRKRGYDVEACPVDWTKSRMICSLADSKDQAFGAPVESRVYRRFERIATKNGLFEDDVAFFNALAELHDDALLYNVDYCDLLEEPYEFDFKGDAALVEAIFQSVGFATRLGVDTPDDGSESHHVIKVAPPRMVLP